MSLRMLGLDISPENIENSTNYIDQSDMAKYSSLPLWRDEYRNSKRTEMKDPFFRSAFDRSGQTKGSIID